MVNCVSLKNEWCYRSHDVVWYLYSNWLCIGTLTFCVVMDTWPYKRLCLFSFTQKWEKRFAFVTPCVKSDYLFFVELCHVIRVWFLTPFPSTVSHSRMPMMVQVCESSIFQPHPLVQINFCYLQLPRIAHKDKRYGNWWMQVTEGEEPGACTYITL